MNRQPHINAKMRHILVTWMAEVNRKFRCVPETLHIAVSLVDQYLTREVVKLNRLQLLGVTALFTASKYEEVLHPSVFDYVYVCDKAYSADDIREMEGLLLTAISFNLRFRTAYSYLIENAELHKIDKQAAVDAINRCTACYELLKCSPQSISRGVLHNFGLTEPQVNPPSEDCHA